MTPRRGTYPIPKDVAARLSSSHLGDVPVTVVAWSPRDASDREVMKVLRRHGVLPPGTNYGVVYQACFEPLLFPNEEPLYLRVAFTTLAVGDGPNGDIEQAWLLVTDVAVRWHNFSDRVPGMPPRNQVEALAPPTREVFFSRGVGVAATGVQEGPGGSPVRGLNLKADHGTGEPWYHSFLIGAHPSTDGLIDFIMEKSDG
jgi:hypothetical protein